MKKVLVISTSLRAGSNSAVLAEAFARGARDAGNEVETISLSGKKLNFCIGCLSCQKTQVCVLKDDAVQIARQMKDADVLAFATPVYYYGMSGQMKTLLDRMNPLFPSDYRFRSVYVLATAADESESAVDGTVTGMQGWVDCFPKARIDGVVRGVGINDANDAKNHTAVLQKAYDAGHGIK